LLYETGELAPGEPAVTEEGAVDEHERTESCAVALHQGLSICAARVHGADLDLVALLEQRCQSVVGVGAEMASGGFDDRDPRGWRWT
jgi:hypothetical protein